MLEKVPEKAAIVLSRILVAKQKIKSDFEGGALSPDVQEMLKLNEEIWALSLAIEKLNQEIKIEEG